MGLTACKRSWRTATFAAVFALTSLVGDRAVHAQDLLVFAPADLPGLLGSHGSVAEPPLRLGFQVDAAVHEAIWVSPAVQAVGTLAALQRGGKHFRLVPHASLQLRSPSSGPGLVPAELVLTSGGTLNAQVSWYGVYRPRAGLGFFAREHIGFSLVQAQIEPGGALAEERLTTFLWDAGVDLGAELGPTLWAVEGKLNRVTRRATAPGPFVEAIEGGAFAVSGALRFNEYVWVFARVRPAGDGPWNDGRWALGIAGKFFPLDG